jgi:hypothetical protein
MPSLPKKQSTNGPARRNRSYGHRSPIDKVLSEEDRLELRGLLQAKKTLKEIQSWLKTAHGCAISQQGISAWWLRRQTDENAEVSAGNAQGARGQAGGFEISVTAPGASEVRLEIRPLRPR